MLTPNAIKAMNLIPGSTGAIGLGGAALAGAAGIWGIDKAQSAMQRSILGEEVLDAKNTSLIAAQMIGAVPGWAGMQADGAGMATMLGVSAAVVTGSGVLGSLWERNRINKMGLNNPKLMGGSSSKSTKPLSMRARAKRFFTDVKTSKGRGAIAARTGANIGGYGVRGAVFGAAIPLAAGIIGARAVDRLAQRMLGVQGALFPQMATRDRPRGRRTSAAPTASRVMRRSGDYSGVGMTGNTVLALHKTGGRGGVRT